MPRKTLHRVLTAITLTLAALLTTTQAIAAPETEGKSGAVKPAASTQAIAAPKTEGKSGAVKPKAEGTIPPFCTEAENKEPPIICAIGEPSFLTSVDRWVCCRKSPYDPRRF